MQPVLKNKSVRAARAVNARYKFLRLTSLVMALMLLVCHGSLAINLGEDDYPWNGEANHPLDKPVKDKYPKGSFFLNLGPTGLRARINEDTPTQFLIKFVFQDDKSPARGKINIGDVVVGANGEVFKTPHIFGRRGEAKGWDGPLMDLSRHIEDSQGSDGRLSLIVWPGGNKAKQTNVVIELEPVGRFAKTYPYACPRSEQMLQELCEFIVSEYERENGWGRIHVKSHCILALMASGNQKYEPLIKRIVSAYAKNRYSPFDGGFTTWNWGFDGIVMGEYYHRYKDKNLIPAIESLVDCYQYGQINSGAMGHGGIFTHRSYPVIVRSDGKPYASIAGISALGMAAMSLFKSEGLKYNEEVYREIHQSFLRSSSSDGVKIAYAFSEGPKVPDEVSNRHAVILLEKPTEAESGKGPGFICPSGMKKITKYKIVWPTKEDDRWKPIDWIEKERERNTVVELTNGERLVFRNHPKGGIPDMPEPSGPFNTTAGSRHILPTGLGAVAHLIGSQEKSWQWFGKHCANTCANTYDDAFSGHGGGQLHGFWMVVGAANADADKQRKFLEYMKSFLILSQTHDGGMTIQPWNRDRPGGNSDPYYGSRLLPTATAVMMLSIPKKRLRIMGLGMSGFGVDPKQMSSAVKSLYGVYVGERYGAAWKLLPRLEADPKLTALDKEAVSLIKQDIAMHSEKALNMIKGLDRLGDVTRLKSVITESNKKLSGIEQYDSEVDPIMKSLSTDPKRVEEMKVGLQYDKLLATVQKEGKTTKTLAALEQFASQHPDSVYGKACAFFLEAHKANNEHKVQRDDYFNKLEAEFETK